MAQVEKDIVQCKMDMEKQARGHATEKAAILEVNRKAVEKMQREHEGEKLDMMSKAKKEMERTVT